MFTSSPVTDPATQLLLCCAALAGDSRKLDRIHSLVRAELDWSSLLGAARRHGMLPLLSRQLLPRFRAEIPQAAADYLERQFVESCRRNSLLNTHLVELLTAFKAARVRMVPFKLPCITGLPRQFPELDLLVSRNDVLPAKAILGSRGYHPQLDWDGGRQAALLDAAASLSFGNDDVRTTVKLHWDVAPRSMSLAMNLDGVWQRMQTQEILGCSVSVLAVEDLLLILSVQGAAHIWERLIWISDVAYVITTHDGIDWKELLSRARSLAVERSVLLAVHLAFNLLETEPPPQLQHRIEVDPTVAWLASRAREAWFAGPRSRVGSKARILFHLRMREHRADRLSYCLRRLTTPVETDLEAVRLPVFLKPLFRGVRFIRLLSAAARRTAASVRRFKPVGLARFRPTPLWIVSRMLAFAEVGRNDVVYDLGCGDGRIVIQAAKRYGARGVGFDIDPHCIKLARQAARVEGVESLVTFVEQDIRTANLDRATVVMLYLQWAANLQLRSMLLAGGLGAGARVVSLNFDMGDWLSDDSEVVDEGPWGSSTIYLWRIPRKAETFEDFAAKARASDAMSGGR